MSKFPNRGDVYWISLDPTVDFETKKAQPGLILSNNSSNKHSNRVIIGPITNSVKSVYPFEAVLKSPNGNHKVMLDQIRSVDKKRLGDRIFSISGDEIRDVERALKLMTCSPKIGPFKMQKFS